MMQKSGRYMSGIKTESTLKNDFVRWMLSEISKAVSSSNKSIRPKTKQKEFALQEFGYKCPYTGEDISDEEKIELDHIIPFNKEHCGLHLRGNLAATSRAINNEKKSQKYDDFINTLQGLPQDRQDRINKIQAYMQENGYDENSFDPGKIKEFVNKQHKEFEAYLERIMSRISSQFEPKKRPSK